MTFTTRGWLRLESRRASISKRAALRMSSSRLIATSTPLVRSTARYTAPMAPLEIGAMIS